MHTHTHTHAYIHKHTQYMTETPDCSSEEEEEEEEKEKEKDSKVAEVPEAELEDEEDDDEGELNTTKWVDPKSPNCESLSMCVSAAVGHYTTPTSTVAVVLPPPPTDITARKWLDQERGEVLKQIQVITIHMLSPFLYGCSHQSDKVHLTV